jgi:uncharacterized protein (TIGR02145 family)
MKTNLSGKLTLVFLLSVLFSCKKDCDPTENPRPDGKVTSLLCSSAKVTGSTKIGTPASGVSCRIEYGGANAGTYPAQSVASSGVTGLTASVESGSFSSGSGFLDFLISGTPQAADTARFEVLIGGISCAFFILVEDSSSSDYCGVKDVFNKTKTYGLLTDVDGNRYRTIELGSQIWMAENLKTSRYKNGIPVPEVSDAGTWGSLSTGASCWYTNDSANHGCPYGKLYNWFAVVNSNGLCPEGWRIPSDEDWMTLEMEMGMPESELFGVGPRGLSLQIGGKMKSTSDDWLSPNAGASNSSGFSVVPTGFRYPDGADYQYAYQTAFWSSTGFSDESAYDRIFGRDHSGIKRSNGAKIDGLSVRCVKE